MKNETGLTITKSGFMALKDFQDSEAIHEELAGLGGGFERIKIPSGGSTVFEMPGDDPNEPDAAKEFSAVILYHHPVHAYYTDRYTGGSNPPDCGSYDGVKGEGAPGGSCMNCPYNQFGSGENGSKACKNRRRIYVLREGEIFPLVLALPTGSLKEFTRYIKRLLSKGMTSNAVVTRFGLKKATNAGGIAFSQATFAAERALDPEEYALISSLSEEVKKRSKQIGIAYDTAVHEDLQEADSETGEIIESIF